MAESLRTAASYDIITKKRVGDLESKESPFRFFSNYVKKILVQAALDHLKYNVGCSHAKVLDLASGRGGDVGKWLHCQSPELSFATAKLSRERLTKAVFLDCYDVSSECINEARRRYEALASGTECSCVFTVRDCFGKEFLSDQLPLSENYGRFNVVSIQFAFHYACKTLDHIDMLMGAIAGALAHSGIFIATTVDDEILSKRVLEKRTGSKGLYSLHFDSEPTWEGDRLRVGTKYRFVLEGFVDCDEYVVPVSYVRERAKYYGMEEVTEFSKPFEFFYTGYKSDPSKNKGRFLVRAPKKTMFPLAATAAGSNPLHAVLTCMLSEMREESAKRTSVIVSDGNWRTRQVVRELKGVKSMAELFSTEDQVRSVVMSQETRCRVKLFNAFLVGQYIVEEQASVMEEEVHCRESLTLHALSVLHNERSLCSLMGQEMCVRYSLVQAYMEERVIFRKSHEVEVLVLCEEKRRWVLAQMEHINRTEIERRRFLSVGREIGVELLRHNFYRFTTWARFQSTHLMHDLALLVTEEERERCTLERLYLLKLSLIANDQENAAARLVVISVMRASLIRRKLQDDHWMRERASRVLALPSDESDKRCIIERKEMEEYQELRVSFLISWREVFKRAMKPDEGTAIVERLEIYERRCVFDQWRFGLNALDEWKDRERRVIVRRENACNVFFQTVIDSLTALWKQENYQFDRLRKQYSDFVWSHQMLQLTLVLEFEETAVRQKIVESEARDALSGRALLYVWQCEEAALREATSIMKMEKDCRSALMEWHQKVVQDVCFKQLFNEEDLARIDIESEAREAWTKFVLEEGSALCGGPCANALGSSEDTQRELLIREERQIFFYHKLGAMISLERRRRQVIRKAEFYHRVNIYASLLDDVERWNRLEVQVEYQHNFLQILLREVEDHESIARVVMMKCEDERRHFLFGSFDYSLPYLRACEVDELNARLDIINEAELTIGALAYRWGMHSHVSLCAEELRLSQCALCFMSSRELLQHREVELVRVLEPVSRRDIIHREITDRLLVLMEAQEERGRIQIEKKAADAYNATQELFDRIISRADQWRTRGVLREPVVLSGREALINYFHRQESFMAIRLRANQEKTRELLGSFFGGFYWGRDAIMVEEFVAREGIMNTFRQPHIPLRALDQTLGSKLTVRFYSLGMMMNDEVQSLFIKMYDSVDDVGVTYELHEAQSVVTAGRVFRVWFPAQLMKWVRPLTNESNVLYFEVRQKDGEVVASASLLLRGEELRRSTGAAATVLSLPSDDRRGKMNVVLYVH